LAQKRMRIWQNRAWGGEEKREGKYYSLEKRGRGGSASSIVGGGPAERGRESPWRLKTKGEGERGGAVALTKSRASPKV